MLTYRIADALRESNPSRTTWLVLGTLAAVGIGSGVFFATRRAAAASAAKKAFSVSSDCMTITVTNETEVRNAATAAALVVHPLPSDAALPAALQMLQLVLPECDWASPPPDRTFVHGGSRYTWDQIEDLLEGRSVGELTELVGQGGGVIVTQPIPRLISWLLNPPPPIIFEPFVAVPRIPRTRPRRPFF